MGTRISSPFCKARTCWHNTKRQHLKDVTTLLEVPARLASHRLLTTCALWPLSEQIFQAGSLPYHQVLFLKWWFGFFLLLFFKLTEEHIQNHHPGLCAEGQSPAPRGTDPKPAAGQRRGSPRGCRARPWDCPGAARCPADTLLPPCLGSLRAVLIHIWKSLLMRSDIVMNSPGP